jgi:hypothetical protein
MLDLAKTDQSLVGIRIMSRFGYGFQTLRFCLVRAHPLTTTLGVRPTIHVRIVHEREIVCSFE